MSSAPTSDSKGRTTWQGVQAAFASGASGAGVRLAPARDSDCLALSPSVAVKGRAGSPRTLGPAEALSGLARRGIVHAAFDARGGIVGLATVRPYLGEPLVGWSVLPDRTGENLGTRIASAAVAKALAAGAGNVWCEAGARNAPALATLSELGFKVEMSEPGLPALFRVDASSFVPADSRVPAFGQGRTRTMERCAPVHPEDWKRRAPSPREVLSQSLDAGSVRLRVAGPGDEAILSELAPFGVVPSGDPAGVQAFIRAMMEAQVVLLGSDASGAVVGSVTVGRNSLGRSELGWVVREGYRGNGHATEMARAVLERLFDGGVDAVDIAVDAGNVASLAVARKLGFEVGSLSGSGVLGMTVDPESLAPHPDAMPAMAA